MKILVTGTFGNLGTYTVRELLNQGYAVKGFDLPTERNLKAFDAFDGRVETVWGDLRDPEAAKQAAADVDVILHLAAIIPPMSDENEELAWQVNVEGTRHLLEAAAGQPVPPRFLFASSFDLFGHTQKLSPPRRATDPIQINDIYTKSKAAGEEMVRASGLPWLIFRFCDMPIIGLRDGHPIMFEIPLDQRFETMHPADAALALANAVKMPELWGRERLLLIGAGPKGQIRYRDFLFGLLTAMGIGPLPEQAFGTDDYVTDWLDTEESQRLLHYQRHSFQDIVDEVAATLGWRRFFVPLARPFARQAMLKMSPYYKK